MATKQALSVSTEFYPHSSEELTGDPHQVVIDADGLVWSFFFYTPDQLCATLATEVTCGRMPRYVATAAVNDVKQWLFDSELAPGRTPTMDAAPRVKRKPAWMTLAGVFVWVGRVFARRGERG
jgi:hypothetical protein